MIKTGLLIFVSVILIACKDKCGKPYDKRAQIVNNSSQTVWYNEHMHQRFSTGYFDSIGVTFDPNLSRLEAGESRNYLIKGCWEDHFAVTVYFFDDLILLDNHDNCLNCDSLVRNEAHLKASEVDHAYLEKNNWTIVFE